MGRTRYGVYCYNDTIRTNQNDKARVEPNQTLLFSSLIMKTHIRLTVLTVVTLLFSFAASAQKKSPSADSKVVKMLIAKKMTPVKVTAKDLVTKVFGVADSNLSSPDLKKSVAKTLSVTPQEDEGGLWLDPTDGYAVSYYGMVPQVSAVAMYDEEDSEHLAYFSYFFLFPYSNGSRENANYEQCAFCTSLLQEMEDIGMDMGGDSSSDALFEAVGNYGENNVNIRLVEQNSDSTYVVDPDHASGDGRYIVVLNVEPGAYNEADHWMAAE